MTSKRGRGRPKGDGVNDDRSLMTIAVMLVYRQAPDYEAAAAAVYLAHKPAGSHVRKTVMDRWRGKWNERGAAFLAQVPQPVRVVRSTPKLHFVTATESRQQLHRVYPLGHHPALKRAGVTTEPFSQQQMGERLNSPLIRPALEPINTDGVNSAFAFFRKYQS